MTDSLKTFVVKCPSGTIPLEHQLKDDWLTVRAIENRFLVCRALESPSDLVTTAVPDELAYAWYLWDFPNGKGVRTDYFGGLVAFAPELDAKGRYVIAYTAAQEALRRQLLLWVAMNVYVPDFYARSGDTDASEKLLVSLLAVQGDSEAVKDFIKSELYYDL